MSQVLKVCTLSVGDRITHVLRTTGRLSKPTVTLTMGDFFLTESALTTSK